MVEVTTKNKVLILSIIGLTIFFSIFAYTMYKYKKYGLAIFINGLIEYTTWILLIGLVLLVLYYLFLYVVKIDVNWENFKNIVDEGKLSNPEGLKYLWLTGDIKHSPVKIGKIVGYSRRENFKLMENDSIYQVLNDKQKEEYLKKYNIKKINNNLYYQEEDCFVFRKKLFSKKCVLRCPPFLHSDVHSNVYVNAISFVKHSNYYYPNSLHLDSESIDFTIYHEGERWTQLDLISKMYPLIERACGLTKQQIEEVKEKRGIEFVKEAKEK